MAQKMDILDDIRPVKIEIERECMFCGYTTPNIEEIFYHSRDCTLTTDTSKCPVAGCQNERRSKDCLDNHMLNEHYPNCLKYVSHTFYQCRVCYYRDVHKYNMLSHYENLVHQVEFKCYHCRRTFDRKRDLIRHFKFHNEEIIYKCRGCGYETESKIGYDYHVVKLCKKSRDDFKYVTICSLAN